MVKPDYKYKSVDDYIKNCLTSKEWRMSNLYYIKTKKGDKVKYKPRDFQNELLTESHPLNLILKVRQRGATTGIQLDMLDDCLFIPNLNAAVVAHNLGDAEAFFKDKIKFAYDNLPQHLIKHFDGLGTKASSARVLEFENGSNIRVGTSLRSSTVQRLHISEYGKLCAKYPDKAAEVRTGALNTVQAGQKIWIESTAEGRGGHFYELCTSAQKAAERGDELTELDFKFHFLTWWDDPDYTLDGTFGISLEWEKYFTSLGVELTDEQKRWYIKKAAQQGDKMKQEFPSTPKEAFEAAVDGAIFGSQMQQVRLKNQITNVPIDPTIPIETFWDLGRDTTSIWFFQKIGFNYRLCDYFENSGEGMAYYANVLRNEKKDGGKPYHYGTCYLPHDGTRKSMGSSNSPQHVLWENGFDVQIVPRTKDKSLSIERARQILPLCWFDLLKCATDTDKVSSGVTHLENYCFEWDEKLVTWKKMPVHDQHSHGADAFMTFADGYYRHDEPEEEDETRDAGSGRNPTTGY